VHGGQAGLGVRRHVRVQGLELCVVNSITQCVSPPSY
jgi:hypothetical protein